MPDLTIETRRVCKGNVFWQRHVKGSRGEDYVVFWGPSQGPYQYGWHCDCPGFQFRRTCKHVAQAEIDRCTAGEEAFCGGPGLGDTEVCPKCGGETEVIRIAV